MIITGLLFLVNSFGFHTQAMVMDFCFEKKKMVVVVVGILVLRFLLHYIVVWMEIYVLPFCIALFATGVFCVSLLTTV